MSVPGHHDGFGIGSPERRTPALAGVSKDGSDGTRTRDLRRDRPCRGSGHVTTDHHDRTQPCGFADVDGQWTRVAPSSHLGRLGHEWGTGADAGMLSWTANTLVS
jgi:hypothetical protein